MSDNPKTADATLDLRIERAAKALAWAELTPKGRETCEWVADFSEGERAAYRAQAVIVMEALGV